MEERKTKTFKEPTGKYPRLLKAKNEINQQAHGPLDCTAQPSPACAQLTHGALLEQQQEGTVRGVGSGEAGPRVRKAPLPPASPRTTTEGPASLYWVLPPQVTLNGLEALRLETNKAEAPPRESASAPWDMCPRSLHHVFCLKGLGSKDLPQPVFCFHFYRKGTVFSFCFLPVKFSLIQIYSPHHPSRESLIIPLTGSFLPVFIQHIYYSTTGPVGGQGQTTLGLWYPGPSSTPG